MHTVIRHTKTENGFAVVISGYGVMPNVVVQEYKQTATSDPHTVLLTEHNYTDEEEAVAFFDSVWFANKVGL